MKYKISISSLSQRFISVEMEIKGPFNDSSVTLQLPSWRPGRYELGNFAKNIRGFNAFDESGNALKFIKTTKDQWRVFGGKSVLKIQYEYYASQPDAGGCWVDHEMLYVNPIHCCMFVPGKEHMKCEVLLDVPADWKIASGMKQGKKHCLQALDFHELVDSPIMASPFLQHASYRLREIDFNIWLYGNAEPEWPKIIKDFEAFTEVQLDTMKEFPAHDYHFLVLLLPVPFYHGVEHLNSTVLAIGPDYKLMEPALYNDFMGVASHELFHSWNVKSIRPVEMLPYDYTRENYAETGYVYEGITTYYGDLFLARSGFFNIHDLLKEFSVRFQKHMDNPGRFNYSVAQSSFDTWLDGYVPGVPGRKTSIYDEGCLIAWLLDFMIRSATDSKKSLDEVMQTLYFGYAKKQKGYTGSDFREVCEFVAGRNFEHFFQDYIYTATSLDGIFNEILSLAGLEISITPSPKLSEQWMGIRSELRNGVTMITQIYPGSPADKANLIREDELISINGVRIENNLDELLKNIGKAEFEIEVNSSKRKRTMKLSPVTTNFYSRYEIVPTESLTRAQVQFREAWISGK